jgi:heme exporter protein A
MRGLTHLLRVIQASRLDPCCTGETRALPRAGEPLGFARAGETPGPQDQGDRTVAIEATRLSKVLGGRRVLHELDLQIAEGQTVALTGANGAGKTTLLRCLALVSRPTAGEVRWFGNPAPAGAAARRLIGLAAHESFLYPYLTVRENLLFVARMYDVPDPVGRAEQLIRRIGLGPCADRWSSALSRGMRQRLAVVRALVHDPPIVLLDEPFAGLDEAASIWLAGLLSDLRARRRTVCFTTHDPRIARNLAHRILHLRSGRIGQPEEVPGAARADRLPTARAA